MEELFFATSPIYWMHTRAETLFLICILALISIIVWYGSIYMQKWRSSKIEKEKQQYLHKKIQELSPEGSDWEQKTLHTIKELLEESYKNRKALSDTAEEIENYIDEETLTGILHNLEKTEYRGETIGEEERKNIITNVRKIFLSLFSG